MGDSCCEPQTPLIAVQNVMAKDDGAIPGESESTDGLIEQYRRCVTQVLRIVLSLYVSDIKYEDQHHVHRSLWVTVNFEAEEPEVPFVFFHSYSILYDT